MINFNTLRVQQKSSGTNNMSNNNSSFPSNNQTAAASGMQQKVDDKQVPQMNPVNTNQIHSQNNNNHGAGSMPQQLLNMQSQHMNMGGRNMNLSGHQQMNKNMYQMTSQQPVTFHQQSLMSSISQIAAINFDLQKRQQRQGQFSYQQQQQQQQQSMMHPSGTQQQMNPNKQMYQSQQNQIKGASAPSMTYGGGSSNNQAQQQASQHHQSVSQSPTKLYHPQLKTTAKVTSPGSQLQIIQKSPQQATASPVVNQTSQQQNKNVPSTPISSTGGNILPSSSSAMITQTPISPQLSQDNKSQTSSSPTNKPPQPSTVTSSSINTLVNTNPANPVSKSDVVPLASSTQQQQHSQPVPANAAIQHASSSDKNGPSENTVTNDTDQKKPSQQNSVNSSKESVTTSPAAQQQAPAKVSNDTSTKPQVDEKKISTPVETASSAAEKDTQEKQGNSVTVPISKSTASTVTPPLKSSAMRLATIPPTTPKKVTTSQKTKQATPVKAAAENSKVEEKSHDVKETATKSSTSKTPLTPVTKKTESSLKSAAGTSTAKDQTVTTPKAKRVRTKVQPYQSPTPEIALVTKLSTQTANPAKNGDDKLTIFYKSEFLAVRNGEGGFYLCQTMHNVYKSSPKIKIRWLNEREEGKLNENGGRIYNLDFYDQTDFECVLTTVELEKVDSKTFELPKDELLRVENILKKAIDVEKGIVPRPTVTEENPDGLDLSLYKDESQLDKISSNKRKSSKKSSEEDNEDSDEPLKKKPATKLVTTPKKINTPRSTARKPAIVEPESSESDEENLMEIKKKAKNQTPAKQEKSPENKLVAIQKTPAVTPTASKGRKRPAEKPLPAVKSPKITKTEKVEEVKPVKQSPNTKVKAVPKKNEKAEVPEKKIAEKKTPVKKTVAESKEKEKEPASAKTTSNESPNSKKTTGKEKVETAAVTQPQTKTSPTAKGARNTRSKK